MEFAQGPDCAVDFTRVSQVGAKVLHRQSRILGTKFGCGLVPAPLVTVENEDAGTLALKQGRNRASYALSAPADEGDAAGKPVRGFRFAHLRTTAGIPPPANPSRLS
jgi:hypothetical protein